jgi:G6PDH family F420-dependent oxidoreductase
LARNRIVLGLELGDDCTDEMRQAVTTAEDVGFETAWVGDHFMPWIHSGGSAGAIWPALGFCLERTKKIKIGPMVTTPIGGRYHPALIAQMSGTLDAVYPGRLLLSVGSGERVNEYPFMVDWPSWSERTQRLLEGVRLMRRLWKSDRYFDFNGRYFGRKHYFLYAKPKTDIPVYISAFGDKTARLAGKHGDGLTTTTARCPFNVCRDSIFPSFDEGAREAGKDASKLEKVLMLVHTFEDQRSFIAHSRKRGQGRLAKGALDKDDPRTIETMNTRLTDEEILSRMNFCSNWSDLVELIDKFRKVGATQVVLTCGSDPKRIKKYAKEVLPHFSG